MATLATKIFSCAQCPLVFNNRKAKTNHVIQAHRPFVNVKYANGVTTTIVRDENGMLHCFCGRAYSLTKSLQRHIVGCDEGPTLSSPAFVADKDTITSNFPLKFNGNEMSLMFIIDDMTLQILQQRRTDIIQYLTEFEVIVCTQCRYALNKGPGITHHLINTHSWPQNEAKEVESRFVGKAIRSPSDKPCHWIFPKPQDPPVMQNHYSSKH